MRICNCPYADCCYEEMQEESFNYRIDRSLTWERCKYSSFDALEARKKEIDAEKDRGKLKLPNLGLGLPHRNF